MHMPSIPPTPRRASIPALLAGLVICVYLSALPATASFAQANELTFHLVDLGINQRWNKGLEVGGAYLTGKKGHHQVFSHQSGPIARILVPMLDDLDLNRMSHDQLVEEIQARLSERIAGEVANGVREFEIQLVQNVRPLGYLDPVRQRLAAKFGGAAYQAIGQALNDRRYATTDIAVDGTFASNGATVFAKSVKFWEDFADRFQRVSFVDGRAMVNDVRNAIDALGARKVRISNSHGDLPAMPLIFGIRHSIANHDVSRSLLDQYPELTVLLLEPLNAGKTNPAGNYVNHLCCHILSAISPRSAFRVTQNLPGNVLRDWGEMTGRDLHPRFSYRDYASFRGASPIGANSHAQGRAFAPSAPLAQRLRLVPALSESKIQVARSALEQLSTTIKTLADTLQYMQTRNDVSGKGRWRNIPTGEMTGAKSRHGDGIIAGAYDNLKVIYDFHIALGKDIAHSGQGKFTVLSSHTLEQAGRFGLSLIADKNFWQPLVKSGKIGADFAEKLKFVTFGVEDIVTAGARHIGSGHADLETVTLYLDGINKAAWAGLGLAVSGGNKKVASTFQAIGGTAAVLGRGLTAAAVANAYVKFYRIDKALIDTFVSMQESRMSRGLGAQTFEAFHGFGKTVLSKLSSAQIAKANAQFGLRSPASHRSRPLTITRESHQRYHEVRIRGYCSRQDLAILAPLTATDSVPTPALAARPAGARPRRHSGELGSKEDRQVSPRASRADPEIETQWRRRLLGCQLIAWGDAP